MFSEVYKRYVIYHTRGVQKVVVAGCYSETFWIPRIYTNPFEKNTMPIIRQSTTDDISSIKHILQDVYSRLNEADFFDAIRNADTFIPELSLIAENNGVVRGYILLSRIGIRTANEILPTLIIQPFCVDERWRGSGVGKMLLNEALKRAESLGFTSCVALYCGDYFKRFGFLPARYEFGLELYFDVDDKDFLALEITEDALYRKSGFLLFPPVFSKIDPVLIS